MEAAKKKGKKIIDSIRGKRDRQGDGKNLPSSNVDFSQDREKEFNNPVTVVGPSVVQGHVSSHNERSGGYHVTRGGFTQLQSVYESLPPAVRTRVNRYPWSAFYNMLPRLHNKTIPLTVVERWWSTTRTFHFRDFEIGKLFVKFT